MSFRRGTRLWIGRRFLVGKAGLVAEFGFGHGEATAEWAAARPDLDHIAFEVYPPGIGALAAALAARDLRNVRVIRADAGRYAARMIGRGGALRGADFLPRPVAEAPSLEARVGERGVCVGAVFADSIRRNFAHCDRRRNLRATNAGGVGVVSGIRMVSGDGPPRAPANPLRTSRDKGGAGDSGYGVAAGLIGAAPA